MTSRLTTGAFLCTINLAAIPVAASAHAFLKTAMPAVGSTIRTAPTEVRIDFTEGVEPKFSSIEVMNAQGRRVDDGKLHLEQGDTHLAIGLTPLAPGSYKVSWQAIATDTHHTQGNFTFTVAP